MSALGQKRTLKHLHSVSALLPKTDIKKCYCDVRFSNRPVGVKHFQTLHNGGVNITRGFMLLYGLGTEARPSWDLKMRWNDLCGDLTVGRSMRTHLIRRPARDISPPLGEARVSSDGYVLALNTCLHNSKKLFRSEAPSRVLRPSTNPMLRSACVRANVRYSPESGHRPSMHCSKERRYSITSSAIESTPAGIVRPSAFAVLRLMTNSNLVDCITGRSAGFAPLRI